MSDFVSVKRAPRYLDCMRNHAAALGKHCVDGCGKFVPPAVGDSLNCAGCGCHRTFHRYEEAEVEVHTCPSPRRAPQLQQPMPAAAGGSDADTVPPLQQQFPPLPPPVAVAQQQQQPAAQQAQQPRRSYFNQEQKTRMEELSERLEWRYLKRDLATIEEGCRQIGVTSLAFKNWMSNTKRRRASGSANNAGAATPPPPGST